MFQVDPNSTQAKVPVTSIKKAFRDNRALLQKDREQQQQHSQEYE